MISDSYIVVYDKPHITVHCSCFFGNPIMEPIWKEDSKTPWTTRWNTNIQVIFRPSKRPSLIPKNLGESPFTTRGISVTFFFILFIIPKIKGTCFFAESLGLHVFFLVHNVIFGCLEVTPNTKTSPVVSQVSREGRDTYAEVRQLEPASVPINIDDEATHHVMK